MSVSPKIDSITWELTSDIAASSERGVQFSETIQIHNPLSSTTLVSTAQVHGEALETFFSSGSVQALKDKIKCQDERIPTKHQSRFQPQGAFLRVHRLLGGLSCQTSKTEFWVYS